ncbi:FkbM family methyltransferase [Gymnodinialimonas ulvae]|uniref:FkbM family methyltransferase n=1 Tax=Gymnodinialimonas ulvae TaxID=3126504 RepID=UPI0030A38465
MQKIHTAHRALKVANAKSALKGRDVRFGYEDAVDLFFAEDGDRRQYFHNFRRGASIYKYGLTHRAKQLWNSYCLEHVEMRPDDVVVDCGANYADLWLTLRGRIAPENYIPFEPGDGEFKSIAQNAPDCTNMNYGLGNKAETLTFYVNEKDADSSFIEPSRYDAKVTLSTLRLDDFVEEQELRAIRLFKLEAEGFEPEILQGAERALKIIDYVAIDGGNERGAAKEQTFTDQANFLFEHGFEMLDVKLSWGRALFRNKALQDAA